ncbi:MAG TPA: AlpA family phage regulatory protein [Candidatus Cybelea sp.]|nr:AlpA family phage regulatory protein [Candidatus Cybelea sp.]
MKAKQLQDGLSYPPRLLRADRAAAYLSLSQSTFLDLVDKAVLPQPIRLSRGIVAWDRKKLDAAVDALERPARRRSTVDEAQGIDPPDE